MADYHYVSTWQLQAPIEQVWAAITDLERLPAWYAGVEEARELAPGTQGVRVGSRVICDQGAPAPAAVFEATITRSVAPREQGCGPRGSWREPGAGRWSNRARSPPPVTAGRCARPGRG